MLISYETCCLRNVLPLGGTGNVIGEAYGSDTEMLGHKEAA